MNWTFSRARRERARSRRVQPRRGRFGTPQRIPCEPVSVYHLNRRPMNRRPMNRRPMNRRRRLMNCRATPRAPYTEECPRHKTRRHARGRTCTGSPWRCQNLQGAQFPVAQERAIRSEGEQTTRETLLGRVAFTWTVRKMLAGFTSRWSTAWRWQCCRASATWMKICSASASGRPVPPKSPPWLSTGAPFAVVRAAASRVARSPPSAYSMTTHRRSGPSMKQSWMSMMLG